ncbi:MAG: DM13 domain-containing protein [Deltaproteobacteria bacterium]|nr:DM13 domain-containing protein [Deltaproteobacteria bacterium]
MKRISITFVWTVIALCMGYLSSSAWAQSGEILAQGEWTKKGYAIDGTWKIVQKGEEVFVVLSDDFSTKKAPDLKIFLSPQPLDGLNNRNATSASFLVAPLRSPKGGQEYLLPAGTNWKDYRSIAIHCEKYSKLWGGAALGAS